MVLDVAHRRARRGGGADGRAARDPGADARRDLRRLRGRRGHRLPPASRRLADRQGPASGRSGTTSAGRRRPGSRADAAALRDRPARGGAARAQPPAHRRHRARGRSRDRPAVAGRGAWRPLRRLARRAWRSASSRRRRPGTCSSSRPTRRRASASSSRKGVAEAKPQHWAQMQVYMHLTGLTRAMYLAVCKDTDDLHVERVRADRDAAERLLAKAARVIHAARPPARISEDPAWFECRFCDHHDVCHGDAAAAVTCRSCLHATPVEGGWHCARWDQVLDLRRSGRAARGTCSSPTWCPARSSTPATIMSSTAWATAPPGSTTPGRRRWHADAPPLPAGRHRRDLRLLRREQPAIR